MRHCFTITMLVLLAGLSFHAELRACSCLDPGSPTDALHQADVVVSGRVLAARLATTSFEGIETEDLIATVAVRAVWKGAVTEQIEVRTAHTCCICGYGRLAPGTEHLLYLQSLKGTYHASSCSRSAPLAKAASDVSALGPPLREFRVKFMK